MQNDYERMTGLYRRYEQAMFRLARSILHDDFLAEDAVQEAFIRLIRARDRLGDVSSPKTRSYVMQTAKSCAVDIYRRRAREAENVTEMTDVLADTLADDGMDVSASDVTAAVMKVSTDCVRKRTERAKKMLEKKLGL